MIRYALLLSASVICAATHAQTYRYTLSWENPALHTYEVELTVETQSDTATWFELPIWRPGRYQNQDFAAAVWDFSAKDARGKPLAWTREESSRWRVNHGLQPQISICYRVYANNADAGSSLLTFDQAYFNPINLFMYVPGRLDAPVTLLAPSAPAAWACATALRRVDGKGWQFEADSWHEFADSPVVLAERIKTLSFELNGAKIYAHFQGDYQGDARVDAAFLDGLKKITAEQAALFGGLPFKEFHHIYRLLPYDLRHAVEHSYSTSYAMPARVTQSVFAVESMFNITSHEFFHVWNVKRLRPAGLFPYDYSRRQYTGLHWFTEGVTDYYASLIVHRAGLSDQKSFLRFLEGTIQSMLNHPAIGNVSPEASSMNSWLATSSYKTPFLDVSFYGLGTYAGLHLDLALRESTRGAVSLDAVMRKLYADYGARGKGLPEDGVQRACEALTGASWEGFFSKYISGTETPDWEQVLGPFGISFAAAPNAAPGARGLGVIQFEAYPQGVYLVSLDPRGDLALRGISSGDVITRVNGKTASNFDLDAFVNTLRPGAKVTFTLNRSGQVLEKTVKYSGKTAPLKVTLSESPRQRPAERQLREAWLRSLAP